MDFNNFSFYKLATDTAIKSFDCNDKDLNEFLIQDAKKYLSELMAVTYVMESTTTNNIVAYFSLLNDKISYNADNKTIWNRLNRDISNEKRRKHYPAVKIGRFAIDSKFARQGLGREIIRLIKTMFRNGNRTGCRFITVDAYSDAIPFYQACGFSFFSNKDVRENTRLMYYDLKRFSL
ncbi:MAG: GNAT family N-acetyltransferase [Paludibacteraceae bacterium]|nr:GNAT family N-acetyltransferase [Paludibacteraceae bacterium]